MKNIFTFLLVTVTTMSIGQINPKCEAEDQNSIFLTYIDFLGYCEIWRIDSVTTDPTELEFISSAPYDFIGLTVSKNLFAAVPEYTMFAANYTNNHYYYHDGTDWVDTGHSLGTFGTPINIGGGNNFIFARNDGTFEIFRYDGTETGTQLQTGSFGDNGSVWDVATDVDDNFYVYNTDAQNIMMFNIDGIPVDTFATTGGAFGVHPGFAIIEDDVYAWTNDKLLYRGVRNGDQFDFTVIGNYPAALQFYDIATCPNKGEVLGTWRDPDYPHLALYPNPADAQVSVRLHNTVLLRVFDPVGRMLVEQQTNGITQYPLDIAGWSAGTYIVEAETAKGLTKSMRLLVQ